MSAEELANVNVEAVEVARRQLSRKRSNNEVHRTRRAKKRLKRAEEAVATAQKEFTETSIYVADGLRHVRPYTFEFKSFGKERWVGMCAREAFKMEFRSHSNLHLERRLAAGRIQIRGENCAADRIIQEGDKVTSISHRHEPPVTSQPIRIVHEDDEVLVINKPSSIPVHTTGAYRHNTIQMMLKRHFAHYDLKTIHRLDRLTSGILIFAKTHDKTLQLMQAFSERKMQKTYLARVVGEFPAEPVTIEGALAAMTPKFSLMGIAEEGKPASTYFERVSYNGHTSVVMCKPREGRMHQIRVHLQHAGHPIVNDPLYNHTVWHDPALEGQDVERRCEHVIRAVLSQICANDEEASREYETLLRTKARRKNPLPTVTGSFTPKAGKTKPTDSCGDSGSEGDKEVPVVPTSASSMEVGDSMPSAACDTPGCSSPTPAAHPVRGDHLHPAEPCALDPVLPVSSDPGQTTVKVAEPSPSVAEDSSAVDSVGVSVPLSVSHLQSNGGASDSATPGAETASGDLDPPVRSAARREGDSFDPLCWICTHDVSDDPHPDSLVLYLHALSYESEGWKYETQWPDWAKEDFVLPEYYLRPETNLAIDPPNMSGLKQDIR